MHVDPNRRVFTDEHRETALKQISVDRGAAGDEEIHLHGSTQVNQVGRRPGANGTSEGVAIDIELMLEDLDESVDLRFFECGNDVDVERRTGLAAEGTRNGPTDRVANAELGKRTRDHRRHAQWIGRIHLHDQSARVVLWGYARAASSRPNRRMASRRKHSRSDAEGYAARMPARAIASAL